MNELQKLHWTLRNKLTRNKREEKKEELTTTDIKRVSHTFAFLCFVGLFLFVS